MLAFLIGQERTEARELEAERTRNMFFAMNPSMIEAWDRWQENDQLLSDEELAAHEGAVFSDDEIETMLKMMGQSGFATF